MIGASWRDAFVANSVVTRGSDGTRKAIVRTAAVALMSLGEMALLWQGRQTSGRPGAGAASSSRGDDDRGWERGGDIEYQSPETVNVRPIRPLMTAQANRARAGREAP